MVNSTSKVYYVYILECKDGSFYTGYTTDLEKRVKTHNAGKGGKYTRGRIPVVLKYYETYEEKNEACKREYAIKQLNREDKLNIIAKNTEQTRGENHEL